MVIPDRDVDEHSQNLAHVADHLRIGQEVSHRISVCGQLSWMRLLTVKEVAETAARQRKAKYDMKTPEAHDTRRAQIGFILIESRAE